MLYITLGVDTDTSRGLVVLYEFSPLRFDFTDILPVRIHTQDFQGGRIRVAAV